MTREVVSVARDVALERDVARDLVAGDVERAYAYARGAVSSARSSSKPSRTRDDQAVLRSVAAMLSRPVTTDHVLRAMVDAVVAALEAERGTLYLRDARTGELCSKVAHLPELREIRLPPGQGLAGHVAETGEVVLSNDVRADRHFFAGIDEQTGYRTRSMLAVPVRDAEGAVRGVLQVLHRRPAAFDARDRKLIVELADQVAEALARTSMRPEGDRGLVLDAPFATIVGSSPVMLDLYARVLAAASSDVAVLLRGESGTGKTLLARAIHDNGARRDGPFVSVDCTALPPGLIESELFGHERGAFTGAERRVLGKFEVADGGTLFLDEIGDLALPLQGKLLRFLQSRQFERLGARDTIEADVRVIGATHADLETLVGTHAFRRDLYYRVRVLELVVPPLRHRGRADVTRLARWFLDVYARRHHRPARDFAPDAMERLLRHDWPGNVRELEHCVESAVVLTPGDRIEATHLSLPAASLARPSGALGYPPEATLAEVERDHIAKVVEHHGGNRSAAARALGIGRNTLLRKLPTR